MFIRIGTAVAVATLIGGCAHAYEPYRGHDGVLAELPANAPPGDCYAQVRTGGEPAGPPPQAAGAQWVLTPGPIGSPGPIWCLVPTGPTPVYAPEAVRYGWIRVLCDRDATPERIGKIQRRLHERGYYRGEASGRYDQATSAAVARFQQEAHIAHGGYLSLDTLAALDGGAGYPESYGYGPDDYAYGQPAYGYGYDQPPAYGYGPTGGYDRYSSGASYSYGARYGSSYGYTGGGFAYGAPSFPCAQPTVCAPPPPPPCCVQVQPCCTAWGWYGSSYGVPIPPYAARSRSAIQNGWLTWQGKTLY